MKWNERVFRPLSLLLSIVLILSQLTVLAYAAEGNPSYSDSSDSQTETLPRKMMAMAGDAGKDSSSWYGNNKDSAFFTIETADQLQYLAGLVNAGKDSFPGKTIYLDSDVSLEGYNNWTPIGTDTIHPFQGTFDGRNHAIDHLTINQSAQNYIGLFGYTKSAAINNVKITSGILYGSSYVGGIVGYANATTVNNCANAANVTAGVNYAGGIFGIDAGTSSIASCSNAGGISGASYVGGICGNSGGPTGNSTNTGSVTATSQSTGYGGGICGSTTQNITGCSNTGTVSCSGKCYLGGILGYISSSGIFVTECNNSGVVTSQSVSSYVGGICGYCGGTIQKSSNTGPVSGGSYVGGILGYSSNHSPKAYTFCWNSGKISTPATASTNYCGGLFGFASYLTVSNCYNTGEVDASCTCSGIAGSASSSTLSFCYNLADVPHPILAYNSGTTASNCYYLPGEKAAADPCGSGLDADSFGSGEAVWLLSQSPNGGVWEQGTVEVNGDDFAAPVLADPKNPKPTVYRIKLVYDDPTTTDATRPAQLVTADDRDYETAGSQISLIQKLKDLGDTVPYQAHILSVSPEKLIDDGNLSFKMPASDVEIHYILQPEKVQGIPYAVAFDPENGEPPSTIACNYGDKVPEPNDPVREGYVFKGWYLDPDAQSSYNFSAPVYSAITLTAKWEIIRYSVVFSPQGGKNGDGTTDNISKSVDYGSEIEKPADPTRSGYLFGGWYEGVLEDGQPKLFDHPFDFDNIVLNKNTYQDSSQPILMFAKWQGKTYTIHFHWNDGTPETVTDMSVTNGELLPQNPSVMAGAPIKEGQEADWYFNSDLSGAAWDLSNTPVSETMVGGDGSFSLYARWHAAISADTSWYSDNLNEFDLTTPEQLCGLSDLVNSGKSFAGKTVRLANDVNLGGISWNAIGTPLAPFEGTFDGNGHAVKGLFLQKPTVSYQGLFGCTDGQAQLMNFFLEGTVTGGAYAGGAVGWVRNGTLSNLINRASVTSASSATANGAGGVAGLLASVTGQSCSVTLKNCVNEGSVYSARYAGGVTSGTSGASSGTVVIQDCVNGAQGGGDSCGKVDSASNYAGGIIAQSTVAITVSDCKNYANLSFSTNSGGIAGGVIGTVDFCKNYGSLTSKSGLAGIVYSIVSGNGTSTVKNCTNSGSMTTTSTVLVYLAGIIAQTYDTSFTVENCVNKGLIQGGNSKADAAGILSYGSGGTTNIVDCRNEGNITGAFCTVGGISALNVSNITCCANTGSISVTAITNNYVYAGGIVGNPNKSQSTLTYNYNRGAITGPSGDNSNCGYGGIAGYCNSGTCLFKFNYSAANVTSPNGCTGAIAGQLSSVDASSASNYYDNQLCTAKGIGKTSADLSWLAPKTSAEMKAADFVGSELDGAYYLADPDNRNGGYPVLAWEENQGIANGHRVVYHLNDGTDGKITVTVADQAKAENKNPLCTGRCVEGWYLNPDCTGDPYDFSAPVTDDLDLYAKWTFAVYTATFDLNDGSPDAQRMKTETLTPTVDHPTVSLTRPQDPTRAGYQFLGWFEGSVLSDGSVLLSDRPYGFGTAVTRDVILYARWNEMTADYSWYMGETYEITSSEQLAALACLANGTAPADIASAKVDFAGKTVMLKNDINLAGICWIPIGTFAGTFDGGGHTVSNITAELETANQGLFGEVTGTVENLTLSGGRVENGDFSGALIGKLSGGSIKKCCNLGVTVSGNSQSGGTGGLVGHVYMPEAEPAVLSGCSNTGNVSGYEAGGIAGNVSGYQTGSIAESVQTALIESCQNTGAVNGSKNAGGIIGSANFDVTLTQCTNTGAVTGTSASSMAGGIAGSGDYSTIQLCSNQGNVSGPGVNGGLVGGYLSPISELYNSFSSGTVTGSAACGCAVGGRRNLSNLVNSILVLHRTGTDAQWQGIEEVTEDECETGEAAHQLNLILGTAYFPYWSQGEGGYPVIDPDHATGMVTCDGTPANGTVEIHPTYANAGDTVTVTASPEAGCKTVLVAAEGLSDGMKLSIKQSGGAADYSGANTFEMPKDDVSVNALFQPDAAGPFTVSFVSGGTVVGKEENVGRLTRITPPENLPPPSEGAKLVGWYTDETLQYPFDPDTLILQNYTLYAKWSAKDSVFVTYVMNGGSDAPPITQEVKTGDKLQAPSDPDGKGGRYFYRWTTDAQGKTPWNFGKDTAGSKNITLYAQWNYYSGKGTESAPFRISNDDGMNQFISQVNSGETFENICFCLDQDMTLTQPIGSCPVSDGFTVPSTPSAPDFNSISFNGIFDGNQHTITLDINDSAASGGVFGSLKGKATIKNLKVEGSVSGTAYLGGIAGYADGEITIENCVNNASVTGDGIAGGLVGYMDGGSFTDCENHGEIHCGSTSDWCYSGGLAGICNGTFSSCSNSGKVSGSGDYIGGIAGTSVGSFTGCTNSGAVEASGGMRVGGICGEFSGSSLEDCTNTGPVEADGCGEVGGISGDLEYGDVSQCKNRGNITGAGSVGGIAGLSRIDLNDCESSAEVAGDDSVGGTCGACYGCADHCLSGGIVTGRSCVGGIAGTSSSAIQYCRNLSQVCCGDVSSCGGIAGNTDKSVKIIGSFSYELDEQGTLSPLVPRLAGTDGTENSPQYVQSFTCAAPKSAVLSALSAMPGSLLGLISLALAGPENGANELFPEDFESGRAAYDMDHATQPRTENWGQIPGRDPYPSFCDASHPAVYEAMGSTENDGGKTCGTVTVNGSASGGFYPKGTSIRVTADATDGYKLNKLWVNNKSYGQSGVTLSLGENGQDIAAYAVFSKVIAGDGGNNGSTTTPPSTPGSSQPAPSAPTASGSTVPPASGTGTGTGTGTGNGNGSGTGTGGGYGGGNGGGNGPGTGDGPKTGPGISNIGPQVAGVGDNTGSDDEQTPQQSGVGLKEGKDGDAQSEPEVVQPAQKEKNAPGNGSGGGTGGPGGGSGKLVNAEPKKKPLLGFEISDIVDAIQRNSVLEAVLAAAFVGLLGAAAFLRFLRFRRNTK